MPLANTQNDWTYSDLSEHHPNCSSITDAELNESVISTWPVKDGVANIPYTFSSLPYWMQPYIQAISNYFQLGIHPLDSRSDSTYQDMVKENIKLGLEKWEAASKGTIKFYETKLGLHSPGISFYFVDEATLRLMNAIAFTQIKMDNNGYLEQAAVVFPDNPTFWNLSSEDSLQTADNINTITHELGHAIGFEHFHENPSIRLKLSNMTDGVFCSVMPYNFVIRTNVSDCTSHCNPPFAPVPGMLDERFLTLHYQDNVLKSPPYEPLYVKINLKNALVESAILSGFYKGLHQFTSNLVVNSDKTFSQTSANVITDTAFLAAIIYLEFPIVTTAAFALSAISKYLPEKYLHTFPEPIQSLLTSNYSATVFNLSLAFYEGRRILPLLQTLFVSTFGSVVGGKIGSEIGRLSARFVNRLQQSLVAKWESPNEDTNSERLSSACHQTNNASFFSSVSTFFNQHVKNPIQDFLAEPHLEEVEKLTIC